MPTEIKAQNTTTLASVKAIYDAADQANTLLDGMQTAAIAAGTTLDGIYQDAADAQTAADDAQASADNASEYAARALGNLSTVQNITETLNWITAHGTMTLTSDVALDPTHVYFVVDPAGDYVVGGTHYSVVTEPDVDDISTYYELSINESLNNYVATHLAVDSEGLWIIPDAGGNKVLIATGSGSTYTTAGTYIVGRVNGVDAVFAKFTADGATMQRGSTGIAHLGYGPGTNSGGGTSNAPYYTLGTRTGTVGNYSVAEGKDTESGYLSHSEGFETSATNYSHSECYQTIAHNGSHAEGSGTSADHGSHAEGYQTVANGAVSHSAGSGTVAQRKSQVAIGEYNIKDTASNQMSRGDYVVIVGNGTDDNSRSNAATLDWSGNLETAGDITDGTGNVLSDKIGEDANGDISITRNITAGGNVEATGDVTDGAGNVLSRVGKNNLGAWVDIRSYTSNNKYTFPSDGYVFVYNASNTSSYVSIEGATDAGSSLALGTTNSGRVGMFVKKGMKCYTVGTVSAARFNPLS